MTENTPRNSDTLQVSDATEHLPIRPWRQVADVVAVVAILGAIGIAIKAPWGVHLMHVAGHDKTHETVSWEDWLFVTEWGRLILTVIGGLIFYRFCGFRPAPLIERMLSSDTPASNRRVFRPAFICALAITALTALTLLAGQVPPLARDLMSGQVPHDDAMKLLWLWPFGFMGAGLSEEVLYRFGIMVPLMGLAGLVFGPEKRLSMGITFWVANILQAALFGLGHVLDGVVASNAGGLLIATLAAPQTWVGLMFGFLFVRRGLESAIICHALIDFLAPGLIILWAYFA